MRRKTPCFSYGDIRRVHRIYASVFVIHSAFFCTCKLNLMKIGIIVKLLSII